MRESCRLIQALLLLVSLGTGAGVSASSPQRQATPVSLPADPLSAVQPEFRDDIAADIDGRLPRYTIAASVLADAPRRPPTIEGRLEVILPAIPGGWADGAWFRLYPNDPAYGDGALRVDLVQVDGISVEPEFSEADTVMRVPVPSGVANDEIVVSMRFSTTVPGRSDAAFGIFSGKPRSGSVAASHWYPMLAGRTPEGWQLSSPSRNGDVVFSNAALHDIELDVPAWMDVALPGAAESTPSVDGRRIMRTVMGPAREVPLLYDDAWDMIEVDAGAVTVRVHGEPLLADEMALVADWAASALETFSQRFGPYPFATLDVVMIDLSGALGMEFPALVVLDPDVFGPAHADNPRFPEIVVAHEIAHQWWYGLVENDQYVDAFIDEGLAQYAGAGIYPGDRYGVDEAERQVQSEIRAWYDAALARSGDFVADQPSDAFPDMSAYGMAVYAKSALGFAAIRAEVGDAAFFAALQQVARDHRFRVIDADILQDAFERSYGCDLDPTWTTWFESAAQTGTPPAG